MLLVSVLSIVIAPLLMPVHAMASTEKASLNYRQTISANVAKEAIENFILRDEPAEGIWETSVVKFKYNLFDIDDTIIGYYFLLYNVDSPKPVGYIIASAHASLEPILEYGEGTLQEFEREIQKGHKIYYLHALNYDYASNHIELLTQHEKRKQETLKALEKEGFTEKGTIKEIETLPLLGLKKNSVDTSENMEEWTSLLNYRPMLDTNKKKKSKILKVRHISQRSKGIKWPSHACGPTTAAMITEFYKNERKFKVRGSKYYGSKAKLVNHLLDELDTRLGGTSQLNYSRYLAKHLNHDEKKKWSYKQFIFAKGHSEDYIKSIEASHPAGILFGWHNKKGVYAKWHWVVGIGYDRKYKGTKKLYVAVKDPDRSADRKWFGWTTNRDYFGFSVMTRKK